MRLIKIQVILNIKYLIINEKIYSLIKVDPKKPIQCDSIVKIDFKGIHKIYFPYDTVIVRDTNQPRHN
jgi:hypothetical protein